MRRWLKNRRTGKPFIQRAEQKVEDGWVRSTNMDIVSKKSPKCEACKVIVAVKTLLDGSGRVCESCYDKDSLVSVDKRTVPYDSVLEENESTSLGETLNLSADSDNAEDEGSSLLDGTQTRGSKRLSGAGAILGELFQATKPTNTPQPKKTKTETEEGE